MLLHGELVTCNFHFLKTRKVFMFMLFGPSGNVHDPQNQLFLTVDPPNSLQEYKENTNSFKQVFVGEISESPNFKNGQFEISTIQIVK